MTSTENDASYYIRIKGRVLGPYSVKQLNTLRVRGQFSQSNEISTDGQAWESAATLDALFGASQKSTRSKESDSREIAASIKSDGVSAPWHYSIDGAQHGPATLAELQEMLDIGRLSINDLVWKEGMAEWSAASDISELRQPRGFEKAAGKKNARRGVSTELKTNNGQPVIHFLDYLLNGVRSIVDESLVSSIGQGSVEVGRYAMYLLILLNLGFCFFYAIKLNDTTVGLWGVGFAAVALVLQYSAVKCCVAMAESLRNTTLRMSSTAILDSMVMMLLVGGFVCLVASSVDWIRTGQILELIIGVAVFVFMEQLGLTLLHPGAIGITISNRARSGEDAIAIVSFFMMLPLRFVPTVFAFGSLLSIAGTATSLYLLFQANSSTFDGEMALTAITIAKGSAEVGLGCALYPFVLYLSFVFAYLIVDVMRSILVIPDKIDQLTQGLTHSSDGAITNSERGLS